MAHLEINVDKISTLAPQKKLTVDWPELASQAIDIAGNFAGKVFEGASEDVEDFFAEGAQLMVFALQSGDEADVDRVKAALRVVAERNRLRIVNEKWEAFEQGITLAEKVVTAALGAVIKFV